MSRPVDRVLITGARGFIGRSLFNHLSEQGLAVTGLDRQPIKGNPGMRMVDLLDKHALRYVMQEIEPTFIFHLAGAVGIEDETSLHQAHVDTTTTLLTTAAQVAPQARILVLGSAAEYGRQAAKSGPVAEGAEAHPDTPYGRSKLLQSQVAQSLAKTFGLRVIRVRLFNTLGPGQGPHLVAAALVKRLYDALHHEAGQYEVSDPHSRRDFLDVRDVARLLWLTACTITPGDHDSPIHIASGKGTSVIELAQGLYRSAGISEKVLPIRLRIIGEPTSYIAETSTLVKELGNAALPVFSLQESLNDMWHWHVKEQESK